MWRWRFKFVPRDIWLGVFIDRQKEAEDPGSGDWVQRTYVCLIPMFPLIIERWWPEDWWPEADLG